MSEYTVEQLKAGYLHPNATPKQKALFASLLTQKAEGVLPQKETTNELPTVLPTGTIIPNEAQAAPARNAISKTINLATSLDPYAVLAKYAVGKVIPMDTPITDKQALSVIPGTPGDSPSMASVVTGQEPQKLTDWRHLLNLASGMAGPATWMKGANLLGKGIQNLAKGTRDVMTNSVYTDLGKIATENKKWAIPDQNFEQLVREGTSPDEIVKMSKAQAENPVDILSKHGLLYAPEEAYIRGRIPMEKANLTASDIINEAAAKGAKTPWEASTGKALRNDYEARILNRYFKGDMTESEMNQALNEADKVMQGLSSSNINVTASRLKEINKRNRDASQVSSKTPPLFSSEKASQDLGRTIREGVKGGIMNTVPEKLPQYEDAQNTMKELLNVFPYTQEEAFKTGSSNMASNMGSALAASTLSPEIAGIQAARSIGRSKMWATPAMATARGMEWLSNSPRAATALTTPWINALSNSIYSQDKENK